MYLHLATVSNVPKLFKEIDMAQRPTSDFDIDPNITSGTDLANILNRFQDAMDSGNSGASRPAYLAAGGMWVKEGDPMRLYLYDGTKDIELYNTTDGIVGAIEDGTVDGQITTWNASSGEWSPEGAVVVDANGNVGIGTDSPTARFDTRISTTTGKVAEFHSSVGYGIDFTVESNSGVNTISSETTQALAFATNGPSNERMRIDASGRVGIGGQPSRSAEEIAKEAKDTLARWKSTFDERLKAEPKADKKAITLEITNDEFDTFPSEETLIERLTERDIGGGDAKLQVAGDGHFSGVVKAPRWQRPGAAGLMFTVDAGIPTLFPLDGDGNGTDGVLNLGQIGYGVRTSRFKDGYFSGKVSGERFTRDAANAGITFTSSSLLPSSSSSSTDDAMDLGRGSNRFKDGYFSGTVYANGSPLTRATDLIETLSTLREATRDETTLEGLRDALSDAIGGLIQKFEAQVSTTES
jgi:hypothetical protein